VSCSSDACAPSPAGAGLSLAWLASVWRSSRRLAGVHDLAPALEMVADAVAVLDHGHAVVDQRFRARVALVSDHRLSRIRARGIGPLFRQAGVVPLGVGHPVSSVVRAEDQRGRVRRM
jgi:hypothetical protein